MAPGKSEPLVKTLRIDARLVGQKLDQLAAPGARFRDRPRDELLADTAAAAIRGDADVLDQTARGALRAQARQDAKLQAADAGPRLFRDNQRDIRVTLEACEGLVVRRRQ